MIAALTMIALWLKAASIIPMIPNGVLVLAVLDWGLGRFAAVRPNSALGALAHGLNMLLGRIPGVGQVLGWLAAPAGAQPQQTKASGAQGGFMYLRLLFVLSALAFVAGALIVGSLLSCSPATQQKIDQTGADAARCLVQPGAAILDEGAALIEQMAAGENVDYAAIGEALAMKYGASTAVCILEHAWAVWTSGEQPGGATGATWGKKQEAVRYLLDHKEKLCRPGACGTP